MADRPTIRLKKTELPIDSRVALSERSLHQTEIINQIATTIVEFNKLDGVPLPGVTSRTVADFNLFMLPLAQSGQLRFNRDIAQVAFRKLVDYESSMAPWTWEPVHSIAAGTVNLSDTKAPCPVIFEQASGGLHLLLELGNQTIPPDVSHKNFEELIKKVDKQKQYRLLDRYLLRINLECIRAKIPVLFSLTNLSDRTSDTVFTERVGIEIQLNRLWMSDNKYKPRSLLSSSSLNSTPQNTIPAEYDLNEAKRRLTQKLLFSTVPVSTSSCFAIATPTHPTSPKPSNNWVEALLKDEPVTDEEIQTGVKPIPPAAEIVTVLPLLQHVREMKKVLRSIMRISKPYDNLSFLPISQ